VSKLPTIKGAMSPIESQERKLQDSIGINCMNGLGVTRERSIAATVANTQTAVGTGLKSTATAERSLERNPSVLSRKELIKQECNLLLETRLPNIMQIMNSEKSIGLNRAEKMGS